MIKNKTYLDIKEILRDVIVPSNSDLIVLKLKEVFQIDSSDINIETIKVKQFILLGMKMFKLI